jgi:hypothetical protein
MTRAIVPQTRRERATNFGDVQDVENNGKAALFTAHKGNRRFSGRMGNVPVELSQTEAEGTALLLVVEPNEFTVPAGAFNTIDLRPFVHVEWGHGGASVGADFEVTYRQRIPLVGSSVEVSVFIKALPKPGVPPPVPLIVPEGSFLKVRAFLSEGIDGERLVPTTWTTQFGASTGVLTDEPARLATLRAWAPAPAAPLTVVPYFLLFDQTTAPVPGDLPIDGQPLDVAGPVGAALGTSTPSPLIAQGETRAYVRGVAWGISSTPFVFTPDPDALEAFISAEFMS